MSSSPKSTSTSTSGSAQTWAIPLATQGVNSVQGVFNQNQPGLQHMTDQVQNGLVPSLMNKFNASAPTAGQANSYYSDVLGGKYLNGNPHLQAMIDQSGNDIRNQVDQSFSMNGRYGSGAMGDALGRQLGQMEQQYRFNDYNNEMGRMDSAAQGATAANTADSASALAALGQGAEMPYTGANNLANSLGALFNGGTSNSKQTGPSPIWGFLGSVAGGVGAAASGGAFCDVRLKDNIVLNHVDPDGLAFYDFTYKPGLGLPEGVQANLPMAQDVAALRPHALGPTVGGFMTIVPGAL